MVRTAGTAATLTILVALLVPACSGCATLGFEETDIPHTEDYTVSENTHVTWTRNTTWGKGNVTLETSRGSIRVTGLDGSVLLARNVNGPIEVKDVTDVQLLETSRGEISVCGKGS